MQIRLHVATKLSSSWSRSCKGRHYLPRVRPTFVTLACKELKALTFVHLPGDLQCAGAWPGSGPAPQGGVAVSEVRLGPEAGLVLGAGRGKVNHALPGLVTYRPVITVKMFKSKNTWQKYKKI